MTNLPETVQWVLDFLNINSTPGKPNLYRFPYECRRLNRPPVPRRSPNLELINNRLIDKSTGYQWGIKNNTPEDRVDTFEVQKRLRQLEKKKTKLLEKLGIKAQENTIENMIEELKKTAPKQSDLEIIKGLDLKKDTEFDGINTAPTLEDFKQFFLEKGIPPTKGKELLLTNGQLLESLNAEIERPADWREQFVYRPPFEERLYIETIEVWGELSRILSNMVWGTETYENEGTGYKSLQFYIETIKNLYLECWKEDELPAEDGVTFDGKKFKGRYSLVIDSMYNKEPFPHYGMIPLALYACIMDFGINHKELHQYLRQCSLCGRLFVPENKGRGRPNRHYCPGECEHKVNNTPTRYDNMMNKRLALTKKRNNDEPKIIKHLMKYYYFQGENGTWDYPNTKEAKMIYNKLPKRITANYDYFIKKWAEPRGYT